MPHLDQSAWESKCFEYAREMSRYHELAALEEERIVPQFILVGDQSSGKTTALCRLAGVPLGFTTNGTGTRRPFEYNLIKDPDQVEPLITVDSEEVSEAALLSSMTRLNGTEKDGFRNEAVSVKIVWKDIAANMMIVDMPGMKDGESGPEDMVLERLKQSNVIPVVVLEPRDMGSVHYVYKVLEKTRPKIDYCSIVAIVNKCDEKMEGSGEWVDEACFGDWWRGAQARNFKSLFCVGWPGCASRNSSNPQQQKKQLAESIAKEADLVQRWASQLSGKLPPGVLGSMGLSKFQEYLNREQASRLRELVRASGPKVNRDYRECAAKLARLEQNSPEKMKKQLSDLMHRWSIRVLDFLDGRFDFNPFKENCSTADADAKWLSQASTKFLWSLPDREEYPPVKMQGLLAMLDSLLKVSIPPSVKRQDGSTTAAAISVDSDSSGSESVQEQGSWAGMLQSWLPAASHGLLGKAAFERDVELVLQVALFRIVDHILTEFEDDFVQNILACPSEDAGNKVVLVFVGRVMDETMHPLVDMLSMLVKRHFDACLQTRVKSFVGCEHLRGMELVEGFEEAAATFVQQLISDFNMHLHERLKEQCFRLQGRSRSTSEGKALATNASGIASEKDAPESSFEAKARAFLEMSVDTLNKAGVAFKPSSELYKSLLQCVEDTAAVPVGKHKSSAQGSKWYSRGADDAGTGSQGSESTGAPASVATHPTRAFILDVKRRFKVAQDIYQGGMSMYLLQRHAGYELLEQVLCFRDLAEKRVEWLKREVKTRLASEMAWQVGNSALKKLARENKKEMKQTKKVLQVLEKAQSLRRELLGESDSDDSDGDSA